MSEFEDEEGMHRHVHYDAPTISWDGDALTVTASGSGEAPIMMEIDFGDGEPTIRTGEDEITFYLQSKLGGHPDLSPGTTIRARAYHHRAGEPIGDVAESSYTVPDRHEHYDAPTISWDGDAADRSLSVTARGSGEAPIWLEVDFGDGEPISARDVDEVTIFLQSQLRGHPDISPGTTIRARAFHHSCGEPVGDVAESSFTVPDPNAQKPKPLPPVITYTTKKNGKLVVTATGTGTVRLEADDQKREDSANASITLSYQPEKGISIEAKACIIEGGNPASDYTTKSINIPPVTNKPQINMDDNNLKTDLDKKLAAWVNANDSNPLKIKDLENRFSKKWKSPKQRLTTTELQQIIDNINKPEAYEGIFDKTSVTADSLTQLLNSRTNQLNPSSSLIPIVGISKVQQARLKAIGIMDVATLLNRGRTPEKRAEIAAKLDLDVRMVNSWVKQADLWRVEGMTTDLAYLLVLAGVRNVEDLSHIDVKKVSPILKTLCSVQTDFSFSNADEVNLHTIIQKAGELANVQTTTSISNVRNQLYNILNELAGTQDENLIRQRLELALRKSGVQDFGSLLSFDEEPPYHLFNEDYNEFSAADLELLNGKNIKKGLDFLDDIQFTLPLPRKISGTVVRRSKDESDSANTAFPGARVSVNGIVSPSDDKDEANENPSAITDGDGHFIIVLPERYSMKEAITITVADGPYKQEFVKSASEIIACVQGQDVLAQFYALDALGDEVDYYTKLVTRLNTKLANPSLSEDSKDEYTKLLDGDDKGNPGYKKELARKTEEYNACKDKLYRACQELAGTAPNDNKHAFDLFLEASAHLEARICGKGSGGELVVINEIFTNTLTQGKRALPTVKLMDNEDNVVRLSTDTAPSRVHKYSLLQRLVEPTITGSSRHSGRREGIQGHDGEESQPLSPGIVFGHRVHSEHAPGMGARRIRSR